MSRAVVIARREAHHVSPPRIPFPAAVLAAALVVSVLLAACAGGGGGGTGTSAPGASGSSVYPGWPGSGQAVGSGDLVPIIVSSDVAVGPNRFLFTLVDGKEQNRLLAGPDVRADVAFYDLMRDPEKPATTAQGSFIWSIPNQRGLYTANVDFGRAGDWGAEVTAHLPGQADRSARIVFPVRAQPRTPAIGSPAPASVTPTATDPAAIARISTDSHPDPDFYRLSLSDAIKSGRPTVLAFTTPLFCKSETCGPTLDTIKEVAAGYKGKVNFVHVEPYKLKSESGQLQPVLDSQGQLETVDAVQQWGLPTEPFTFVIDRAGKVSSKLEGVSSKEELAAAIDAVLK